MPVWSFALGDGLLEERLWMEHGVNASYVRYTHLRGSEPIALSFRAFVTTVGAHPPILKTFINWSPIWKRNVAYRAEFAISLVFSGCATPRCL